MLSKNCCHSNLNGAVIRVDGNEVPYSICSKCESIWLDREEAVKISSVYCGNNKNLISDFQCPRCRDIFLETVNFSSCKQLKTYQCRKCSGIRIDSGNLKKLPKAIEICNPFDDFVQTLSSIFNRELSRKKSNKLPPSFKINKTEETDYKCPECRSRLSSFQVYENDPENVSEFDICDSCYGIWFDKDDMVARREGSKKSLQIDMDNITPTERTCPKCKNIKLVSLKYLELDTIIDCCPDCLGTWLDGGELYEFATYLGQSGQEIIDILIDNALFKDPVLIKILKQFSRTLHKMESRNREQEENLDQAREIQEKLIFGDKESNTLVPFIFNNYAVLRHWIPAKVVGGDYFAVIPFNYKGKELLGICIADVSGKGLPASLLMANLQALLNSFALHTNSPAKLCKQLNGILHGFTTSNKFITFFYGVLDSDSGSFTYCNGGHNPPVFLSGGRIHWLKTGGSVLSFFPDWEYKETRLVLKKGDRILFYTDGASETENPSGEEFGEAKLASLLKKYNDKPFIETMNLIIRDIKEYNLGNYIDDTTLLLLERTK